VTRDVIRDATRNAAGDATGDAAELSGGAACVLVAVLAVATNDVRGEEAGLADPAGIDLGLAHRATEPGIAELVPHPHPIIINNE
jgi:hypothetical protein